MKENFSLNALGLSHKAIAESVSPGEFVIDATAGRGRDTLFLSKLVGESGKVIAFDVQEEAVLSTQKLLSENGVKNASVIFDSHSHMDQYAAPESASAVMFNFGWLPGGDHRVFTQKETSIAAIQKALAILRPGGLATLCIYYGKETGYEEKDAILSYLKSIDPQKYTVLLCDFTNRKGEPPLLALIRKEDPERND